MNLLSGVPQMFVWLQMLFRSLHSMTTALSDPENNDKKCIVRLSTHGFPKPGQWRWVGPLGGGGVDLRRGHFSAKIYAKTKELGPIGGMRRARPLDLPMQTSKSPMLSDTVVFNTSMVMGV